MMIHQRFTGLVITDDVSGEAVAGVIASLDIGEEKWFVEEADLYPDQTLVVFLAARDVDELEQTVDRARRALAADLGVTRAPTEEELDALNDAAVP